MYCKVYSATLIGVGAEIVTTEADIGNGLPSFEMVGMLSAEVKEARERVRTAIKNTGYEIPPKKITVNLSPADVRKAGNYFDLSIAVALLHDLGYLSGTFLSRSVFIGELGLDGTVCSVNGVLPIVDIAKQKGFEYCFIPKENGFEGGVFSDIIVVGVKSLAELVSYLNGEKDVYPEFSDVDKLIEINESNNREDFADIKGQEIVKRGVMVAIAGMHNIMLAGPPGAGKTMIAKRIPTILPALSTKECIEISKIYSAAGMLGSDTLMCRRPFRETHHSITPAAMIGGGRNPKPGQVTLAHKGVLFLDEYPEYNHHVLELLRQPLESYSVSISRANCNYVFPADFQLTCAMNLCPCGYYPDRNKCNCTEYDINRYLSKISGPIIDRIDIGIFTPKLKLADLKSRKKEESSASIRKKIEKARKIQERRYMGSDIEFNSRLSANDIKAYCTMTKGAQELLNLAFEKMELSGRGYYKIIKVARTISDLDESYEIEEQHMAEAISYRIGDLREMAMGGITN